MSPETHEAGYDAVVRYVHDQQAKGSDLAQITAALKNKGWADENIAKAIAQAAGHGTLSSPSVAVYAPFFSRLLALIVDNILLVVAYVLLLKVLSPYLREIAMGPSYFLLIFLAPLAISWIYFAGFQSSVWQATVGKHLFRLYVIDASGRRLTFLRATGRYAAKMMLSYLLVPNVISLIMAAVHPKKQTLHDLIASTSVIKR